MPTGGGLAEITLTFDHGKVMYGFCSLKEPTAALPRYILINWVSRCFRGEKEGEGRKVKSVIKRHLKIIGATATTIDFYFTTNKAN